MIQNQPLVSIGVPVHNDAPWLRNALDHLLAQDYQNLEIIIADNLSTDGSREICREYAQRDARIRLFENKYNIGATENHRLVFEVSTSDYFTWGSGHDYFEPSFISRMLEVLLSNPSVVMCCVRAVAEDTSGKVLSTATGGLDTRGLQPVERLRYLLDHQRAGGTMNIIHGLYRSEKLAQIKSIWLDAAASDVIMLGELGLAGDITQVDEILHHRVETFSPSADKDEFEVYQEWLKKLAICQGNDRKYIPLLNSIYEYQNMIDNSRLSSEEKEYLWEDVKKMAEDWSPTIRKEVDYFIVYSKEELSALEHQPAIRRFKAMQILTILEQAWLFGFDRKGSHKVRSLCLSVIGLDAESRAAVLEELEESDTHHSRGIREIFRINAQRVADRLHKLLGDKTWYLLKRILLRNLDKQS